MPSWPALFALFATLSTTLPLPSNIAFRRTAISIQFPLNETSHVDVWLIALGAAEPAAIRDVGANPTRIRMYRGWVEVCGLHVEVWSTVVDLDMA
jgi:hypothetical protein